MAEVVAREEPVRDEPPRAEPRDPLPKTYCNCWREDDEHDPGNPDCGCGEEINFVQWRWEEPIGNRLYLCDDQKQVIFHPYYSSGTAVAKGNVGLVHNQHYYWEIKMQTEPYGTDIMVGLGARSLNPLGSIFDYKSFLGSNNDSYGLSYTGAICHNSTVTGDCPGFCQGTIIGVRVDMFKGTVEFYLNREPQGISFYDLKRHQTLFPMVSSTAAQSSLRLIYAASWHESLLVRAAGVLASPASIGPDDVPPGIRQMLKSHFWMTLPSGSDSRDLEQLAATISRKYWLRRRD